MLIGIAFKIAATLVFAIMSAAIKFVSAHYSVAQIVFFRSLFALIVTALWLHAQGHFPSRLATQRPFGHVLRSVSGGVSMALNFAALALLPLPDVTALGYTTPLIIFIIAALLLGEAVTSGRVIAVVVGFIGVMIMLWEHVSSLREVFLPSHADQIVIPASTWGVMIVLSSTLFLSVAMIQTRRLAQSEHIGAIVFYFQSTTMVLSTFVMICAVVWPPQWIGYSLLSTQVFTVPDGEGFMWLSFIGMIGGVGQILMTQSYRYADASIIAIFDYTSLLWTSALGIMFFGDIPSFSLVIGALIVAGSSLFVVWSENRSRRSAALIQAEACEPL
jgi:drug/metabolite transporter (DMT)-like permease